MIWLTMIVFVLIGMVLWTFAEYMLHRFLGHVHKGVNFFKKEHVVHHAKVNYFAPVYKKIIAVVIIAPIMLAILSVFLIWYYALSFIIGFLGMYMIYEITHYRYHTVKPLIQPFIILRKHHFYHHFHNPKMNHGVTTRIWDKIFGTFATVNMVKVPKQMMLPWLLIKEELNPKYVLHFKINSR